MNFDDCRVFASNFTTEEKKCTTTHFRTTRLFHYNFLQTVFPSFLVIRVFMIRRMLLFLHSMHFRCAVNCK